MATYTQVFSPRLVNYTIGAAGSSGPFDIPFTFQDNDEVRVYINGVETALFGITKVSEFAVYGNVVNLESPTSNSILTIASDAGQTRGVGNTFSQAALSLEIDKLYQIIQEIRQNGAFTTADGTTFDLSLKKVKVADPTEAGDILNYSSIAAITLLQTNAATSATNAAASATAAASSENAVATNASTATTQAGIATTKAGEAATSASEASTSAGTATTQVSLATAQVALATTQTGLATAQVALATTQASTATTQASTATTQAGVATTKAAEAAASAASLTNAETNSAASASAASGSATSAANSAASAASALDNFEDKYLGSLAAEPTTDLDGNALVSGALYFSQSSSSMQVFDGANWIAASSAGVSSLNLFEYTATAGQTTFSGTDDNGSAMSFITGNNIFALNGIILDPSDFNDTSGTSVVLADAAVVGDLLNAYCFKSFTVADTVSASTGGTFAGNVAVTGNITVTGTVDGRDVAADGAELDALGTAADYATAAQGTLAASALQPTGDGSQLTGISGAAESIATYATAPSVGAEGSVYYNTSIVVL